MANYTAPKANYTAPKANYITRAMTSNQWVASRIFSQKSKEFYVQQQHKKKEEREAKQKVEPEVKKPKEFNFSSIGELYNTIEEILKHLDKDLKWNQHPERQLDPGMGFAPKMSHASVPNQGLIHVSNLQDALTALNEIRIEGEGTHKVKGAVEANSDLPPSFDSEFSHYHQFIRLKNELVGHYETWPVTTNINIDSDFAQVPNLVLIGTAFNMAYSYLMLLLETAWQLGGVPKRNLIVGGLPVLMSGILAPLANVLVQTPLGHGENAGPPFSFYLFTTLPNDHPKAQLIKKLDAALKAFPTIPILSKVLDTANHLPELSYPIIKNATFTQEVEKKEETEVEKKDGVAKKEGVSNKEEKIAEKEGESRKNGKKGKKNGKKGKNTNHG
jgi:hypothetical protein